MAPTRTAALGAALTITLGGAAADVAEAQPTALGTPITALTRTRLLHADQRLLRKLATARGEHVSHKRLARLRRESIPALGHDRRVLTRRLRTARSASTASPALQAIAVCESGGDPNAIGGGGAFRGKYQFTYSTWASVGGSGDPASAPAAEQDRRAAALYARTGPASWPVCGR
jgi:hypothetical protein